MEEKDIKIPSNLVMTQGQRVNVSLRENSKGKLLALPTENKLLLVVLR